MRYKSNIQNKSGQFSLFLGILSSLFISCTSRNTVDEHSLEPSLTKEEMIEDYELFQDLFNKANPGLHDFHSKRVIDSLFAANKGKITSQTSYREFYNIIWNVVDYTGSIHNNLFYPDTLESQLKKETIFFPLPLIVLNEELYSSKKYRGIPLASKIVSVNGIKGPDLLKKTSFYRSTDGYNVTAKHAAMSKGISSWYIYLSLGPHQSFVVEYEDEANQIKKVTLEGVSYSNFEKIHSTRHGQQLVSFKDNYHFRFIDSLNTGVLTINTFALGGPQDSKHRKYAHYLDSVFTLMDTRKTPHLIVDVRKNSGGSNPNQTLLYSFLTNRDFKMTTKGFTLFNSIPLKSHYMERIENEIQLGETILQEQYSNHKDRKYYLLEKYNPEFSPQKNAFKGDLYLLIGPYVASAGSLFASMVKSDQKALVIGEETGGGYRGHTGNYEVLYQLPHSQLKIKFSIVSLTQDVKPLKDQKKGRGVMPDVRISPSREDFLKGNDPQLEWILRFIKQKTQTRSCVVE